MLLELKNDIVYGPVQSRRLGPSLGINILPGTEKACTFNCLYCQYGWTDFSAMDGLVFPTVQKVLDRIECVLQSLCKKPKYITLSGNGEPTLHQQFPDIVDGITQLRDRFVPSAKTAILSNSTRVNDPHIRAALSKLDVRIMKLDAGSDETFQIYNNPCPGIILDDIVDGLSSLRDVTIQSLFTEGSSGNFNEANISSWIKKIKQISPLSVQIYTLDRGYPSGAISKLEVSELVQIKHHLEAADIHSEVY